MEFGGLSEERSEVKMGYIKGRRKGSYVTSGRKVGEAFSPNSFIIFLFN